MPDIAPLLARAARRCRLIRRLGNTNRPHVDIFPKKPMPMCSGHFHDVPSSTICAFGNRMRGRYVQV